MKAVYTFVLSAVVMLTCSCKGGQEGSKEESKVDEAKEAVTEEPAEVENVEEEPAEEDGLVEAPITIQTKRYIGGSYYRGEIQNPFIVSSTMLLDWPVSANGYDITPLQQAVWEIRFSGKPAKNIQKEVDKYVRNASPEGGWVDCEMTFIPNYDPNKDAIDQEPLRDPDGEYPEEVQYDASTSVDVYLENVDELRHLVTYSSRFIDNAGCGMGSCIQMSLSYMVYDYVDMKVIKLKDIVAKPSVVAKKLYKMYHEENEGLSQSDLTENFYIDDKGQLVFVYQKYEISFGAAGCPELTIDPEQFPDALTEYGKKILLKEHLHM